MPPKKSTRSASRESTPAPTRRSTRQAASRETTPVAPQSVNRRQTRSQSPQKKETQQALPQVKAAGSSAYGSTGRTTLASPVLAPKNSLDAFEEDFGNQVGQAQERFEEEEDDDNSIPIRDRLPPTIQEEGEEDEEEEEDYGDNDEDDDSEQVQIPVQRQRVLRTPANESTTYHREEDVIGDTSDLFEPSPAPATTSTVKNMLTAVTAGVRRVGVWRNVQSTVYYGVIGALCALVAFGLYQSFCQANDSSLCVPNVEKFPLVNTVKEVADTAWSKIPSVQVMWSGNIADEFSGNVYQRVSSLEAAVKGLHSNSKLHDQTLKKLDEILPDILVVPKNRRGDVEIPSQFWQALKDKVEHEFADKLSAPAWDSFMAKNEAQLNKLLSKQIDIEVQKVIQNERIVTKEAFTTLLQENYVTYSDDINRLRDQFDLKYGSIISDWESNALALVDKKFSEKVKKIPAFQLASIATANLVENTNLALKSINYFSPAQGAVIDPYLTSPTAKRDSGVKASLYKRLFFVRDVNPPVSALESWEEAGDCWCASPAAGQEGTEYEDPSRGKARAQLAVLMAHRIFPTRVTVEHIPSDGTLDIHAAPRDMELWVEIDDPARREEVRRTSATLFAARIKADRKRHSAAPFASHVPYASTDQVYAGGRVVEELPPEFVRIAAWEYDIRGINHVQTFTLDVELQKFGASVTRAVVRVLGNYGREYTCLYRVRMHGVISAET